MNNAVYNFPLPQNEPILDYLEGSPERILWTKNLKDNPKQLWRSPDHRGKEIRTETWEKSECPMTTAK